ncbi:MAG: BMP family ABC transporter substrate-binding protein [Bacillota bacterium]|nr:BMP family ABC transporter substrate-binding protein [Bacillota bacterium]
MKKLLALILSLAMILCLVACGKSATGEKTAVNPDLKVGVILVGDENEGYTFAHIDGIKKAAKELGIKDDQIIWKYSIGEDQTCYDAAAELVDSGCKYVFSNSYGHQSYIEQAAKDFPNVTFVAMTGDTAAKSGLNNFCNAFTNVYESRYVSGVVAGMKLAELIKDNKLASNNFDAKKNVKLGYVGAYPYSEVVSGYTAFYLGVKSIVPNVVMDVTYTNSWFNITAEGEAAKSLIAGGCVIIGQHADSTGAPAAIQAINKTGKPCYSVGYNVDMLSVAPDAALTSATNNWAVYYTYALGAAVKGEKIAQNWSKGYAEGAVAITKLGSSCADGTQKKVDEVIKAIKDGTLHVFDTSTWTAGGKTLTSYTKSYGFEGNELIKDGYFHESELRSAPAFDIRIDGITELN